MQVSANYKASQARHLGSLNLTLLVVQGQIGGWRKRSSVVPLHSGFWGGGEGLGKGGWHQGMNDCMSLKRAWNCDEERVWR